MFDIGWSEMALVAVIALFVVGPKDLPHVLYKLAGYWKKVRGMAREFQGGIDDLIREAELDDLRKQVESARNDAANLITNKMENPQKPAKPANSPSSDMAGAASGSTTGDSHGASADTPVAGGANTNSNGGTGAAAGENTMPPASKPAGFAPINSAMTGNADSSSNASTATGTGSKKDQPEKQA